MNQAFPLTWPEGRPRTPAADRGVPQFGKRVDRDGGRCQEKTRLTIADAIRRVQAQLAALKAEDVLISTNQELNRFGVPRSDRSDPADPGAAVYFTIGTMDVCLACDRWARLADNLAAIAKHIEATRGQERWGVGSAAESFRGYAALEAPTADRPWRATLGFAAYDTVTPAILRERYKKLALERHPDSGGSNAMMAELNTAYARAKAEVGP